MTLLPAEPAPSPRIRSFIRRQGRMTCAQQLALATLWDRYCLDHQTAFDAEAVFARAAPLIVEIGFGNGESLAETAKHNPDKNYLGIEVHKPGVGHLMMLLNRDGLTNVRIYCHDALDILEQKLTDASLSGVHLFFPDPWPKKKHHKRRLVRPEFCRLLARKLAPGGYFHAATDWRDYAQAMLEQLTAEPALVNASSTADYCPRPDSRPLTKFERRGLRLGHGVWDLLFTKRP